MKTLRMASIALLATAFLAGTADAQKKTTKKPPAKKPVSTTKILPPLEVRAAREKVDIQLSNVNGFINTLGPIAVNLERADADAKAGRLSAASVRKVEVEKGRLIEAIRELRIALSSIETEFRTKPDLKRYLSNINGISALAAESEDSAIAGKFVLSKEPLRAAAQRMADTLVVMPKAQI